MDNVYTLNEIVQGRFREDKQTYAFFLDVQKAYDTAYRDGLWLKLWDMGVKGRILHVNRFSSELVHRYIIYSLTLLLLL